VQRLSRAFDRYTRLYPPMRGLELDGETLEELAKVCVCVFEAMPFRLPATSLLTGSVARALYRMTATQSVCACRSSLLQVGHC
jgi:hypothetical protein